MNDPKSFIHLQFIITFNFILLVKVPLLSILLIYIYVCTFATIVSLVDMIAIGLRTSEESHPSDSFTAVITLTISHIQLTHAAITRYLSTSIIVHHCQ